MMCPTNESIEWALQKSLFEPNDEGVRFRLYGSSTISSVNEWDFSAMATGYLHGLTEKFLGAVMTLAMQSNKSRKTAINKVDELADWCSRAIVSKSLDPAPIKICA